MLKKLKHKNIIARIGIVSSGLFLLLCVGIFQVAPASAQETGKTNDESHFCKVKDGKIVVDPDDPCIAEKIVDPTGDPALNEDKNLNNNPIINDYINPGIRVLTVIMGIVVAIAIVISGIQYASAGGDPSKVVSAKQHLSSAILALLAYLFMFSFLQWLLPGGVI